MREAVKIQNKVRIHCPEERSLNYNKAILNVPYDYPECSATCRHSIAVASTRTHAFRVRVTLCIGKPADSDLSHSHDILMNALALFF